MERLKILENGETYDIKKKARKEIIRLEKHLNDVNGKIINGKHYGERIYHSDDKPMNKEEIFKLIDSVDVPRMSKVEAEEFITNAHKEDLSGVFIKK